MYFKCIIIIITKYHKRKSPEYARMGWPLVTLHPSGSDWLVVLFVRFAIGDSDLWKLGQAKRRAVSCSDNTNRLVWKI